MHRKILFSLFFYLRTHWQRSLSMHNSFAAQVGRWQDLAQPPFCLLLLQTMQPFNSALLLLRRVQLVLSDKAMVSSVQFMIYIPTLMMQYHPLLGWLSLVAFCFLFCFWQELLSRGVQGDLNLSVHTLPRPHPSPLRLFLLLLCLRPPTPLPLHPSHLHSR